MKNDASLAVMSIKGLIMDPVSDVPIVVLRDDDNSRFLPIWIGAAEAHSIAIELEGIKPPRPLTHDLLINTMAALDTTLEKVTISSLKSGTFYAELTLKTPGGELVVDSRPSDALALAARASAPILVAESVLEEASRDERTEQLQDDEALKKYLEDLDEEDLGDYKM